MIGERLAETRKDHGDTQSDLARELDVSLSTVRTWEQDKSSPGHDMLVRICKLYNVSSDYLLGLSDIDPIYEQNNRLSALTDEEFIKLKDYVQYLLWKRKAK